MIFSGVLSLAAAFSSFAASAFPYDIQFDVDKLGRVCYAGHPGSTVVYKDGIAVTPDTSFRIVPKDASVDIAPDDISVSVSLIYENDKHSGSYKEVVKEYAKGDIDYGEDLRLISDNAAESLDSRDKLYSDSLSGLEMTITAAGGRELKKKTIYLYMCSDDDIESLDDTAD